MAAFVLSQAYVGERTNANNERAPSPVLSTPSFPLFGNRPGRGPQS
jgi:hypothetical protein